MKYKRYNTKIKRETAEGCRKEHEKGDVLMHKRGNTRDVRDIAPLLKDYRQQSKVRYPLYEIIILTIISVMAGMKEYEEFEIFCTTRREEIEAYIPLSNGVPTRFTFRRVLSTIAPEMLEGCYRYWALGQLKKKSLKDEFVALDGKTLRGSDSLAKDLDPIHVVSAWLNSNSLTLGQCYGTKKDSEIIQIPQLIKALKLKGSTVTIDAIACQMGITATIREQKADYIIAVEDNQPNLHQEIQDLGMLSRILDFVDVKSIGKAETAYTDCTGQSHHNVRYYITSLSGENALAKFAKWVFT